MALSLTLYRIIFKCLNKECLTVSNFLRLCRFGEGKAVRKAEAGVSAISWLRDFIEGKHYTYLNTAVNGGK